MKAAAKTRFDTLDAMRGVAALLVVPRHTDLFGASWANSHSYLAVDLFFMLSGFVIANAYERHLQSQTMSTGKFILIRLVRFYPLLILAVLLGALSSMAGPLIGATSVAGTMKADWTVSAVLMSAGLSLFFLPSKLGDSTLLFPLNTAIWSLMYEVAINIAFALTLAWWTTRRLTWLVLGSAFVMAVMGVRITTIDLGWAWSFLSIIGGTVRTVFGFAMGVLLFRLFAQGSAAPPKVGATVVLCMAAIPLMVPTYKVANGLIDVVATLFIFPLAIWLGAHTRIEGKKVLIFSVLGTLSYPIYVLHVPLLRFFEELLVHPVSGHTLTAAHVTGPVFATILLGLAWLLDAYYDQPVRKWLLNRWGLSNRRTAAPQVLSQSTLTGIELSTFQAAANVDLAVANKLLPLDEALPGIATAAKPVGTDPDKSAPAASPSVAP